MHDSFPDMKSIKTKHGLGVLSGPYDLQKYILSFIWSITLTMLVLHFGPVVYEMRGMWSGCTYNGWEWLCNGLITESFLQKGT